MGQQHALTAAKADGKRAGASVREMRMRNIQLQHDLHLLEEREETAAVHTRPGGGQGTAEFFRGRLDVMK